MILTNSSAYSFMLMLLLFSCSKENVTTSEVEKKVQQRNPITGSRISWDYSTLNHVSAGTPTGYNGYSRVIQLHDKSLMCVYESAGNVIAVKSKDSGKSWSEPITVAKREPGRNMAVPDVIQLQDQSILVSYNPRPYEIDPSRRFGIKTKKSYDNGLTWKDERLLYEAGYQFENGCWEPSAVQLPGGEIQVFFANEGPYMHSSEQNISFLRSSDGGLTWTDNAETASFRKGSRDGMPVPLFLPETNEVIVAIEDNGNTNFKPYIIRNSLEENWETYVSGESSNRTYALKEPIDLSDYAGAPYIQRLSTGEVILSYQGTEGRISNNMGNADMKVTIGSEVGKDFDRKTAPFVIPADNSCLWNSISVMEGDTVIALTSTKAFSTNGSTQIWMVKGYVLPETDVGFASNITIDGAKTEDRWNYPQMFIGRKGPTQMKGSLAYDDEWLYILTEVKDNNVNTPSPNEKSDGTTIYLDTHNKSTEEPDAGVFNIYLAADNNLIVKEGERGDWKEIQATEGIISESRAVESGYVQELAVSWSMLGGKPELGTRIGFNMSLTENAGDVNLDYIESLSSNEVFRPYTWMTLRLK